MSSRSVMKVVICVLLQHTCYRSHSSCSFRVSYEVWWGVVQREGAEAWARRLIHWSKIFKVSLRFTIIFWRIRCHLTYDCCIRRVRWTLTLFRFSHCRICSAEAILGDREQDLGGKSLYCLESCLVPHSPVWLEGKLSRPNLSLLIIMSLSASKILI